MKSFQELKKNLVESENTEGGGFNAAYDGTTSRSAASDYGIHRVENSTQRTRLQAFLNAFSSRDYLDPRSAIALLRAKLNLAGLDFDFHPGIPLLVDTPIKFPLTRFGGTFGLKIKDGVVDQGIHDEFERTDGISQHNGGRGLALNVMISNTGNTGLFKFTIRLEDSESNPPTKL
jgi:hypothetical protein